jgi:hypothetical protein
MKDKKSKLPSKAKSVKTPKKALPPPVGVRGRFDQLLDDAIFGVKKK